MPLKAEAKRRSAPGARSWTICAMARPSSLETDFDLFSSRTSTGVAWPHSLPLPGKSALFTSSSACVATGPLPSAASVAWSKESERTPTVMPAPTIVGFPSRKSAARSC